jgi:hydroxymethylpyrimidine/phosphomethylpyrimidine kinase
VNDRVLLTVAGSDSGGGAGIQADLRAFWDHGWHGTTVITAVTAQNTRGVTRIDPIPAAGILAQLRALRDDVDIAAVKVGMLADVATIEAVAEGLSGLSVPIVVDPVMVATSGDRLQEDAAVDALRSRILPLATVLTPNLPEQEVLGEIAGSVLITGGDAEGQVVLDTLHHDGVTRTFRNPRIRGGPYHGTGCTLSSALTAQLAKGQTVPDAVELAILYVRERLQTARRIGGGSAVLGDIR